MHCEPTYTKGCMHALPHAFCEIEIACMLFHMHVLRDRDCMHAVACMQSRSRNTCMWKSMHAISISQNACGRACMQPFVYVGSHACKSNTFTWLKVRLSRSIYTWHLYACESLRYFFMHFFEFRTLRHRSLLIASARLDFRQKIDSNFDPVFKNV